MKIGIFFGGPSREREVSFAGGRTALTHIDKALFEPVMVFVDGLGNFILIREEFLHKSSIRAFYPRQTDGRFSVYIESLAELSAEEQETQINAIGQRIQPQEFSQYFDLVFLAMHGPDCEDGGIQGLLEWYKIPYTGPGLLGSAVGINKILQNELIALVNRQEKKMSVLSRTAWDGADKAGLFESLQNRLGLPIVVKAPHQGSSIGVVIVRENDLNKFIRAVDQCFFRQEIDLKAWKGLSEEEKLIFVQDITELDSGIAYPVVIEETGETVYHPSQLLEKTESWAAAGNESLVIASNNAEDDVLFEEFISGQEFSCGVIQDDEGTAVALPPTEIYNVTSFDFKSKYQSNTTKKRIPVETSLEHNREIQLSVAEVFTRLGMNVCARIDGFLTPDQDDKPGRVLLHDPNTIPGMSPTSLIFKQMAEIGLNVTQAITYFIRQSLRERIRSGKDIIRLRQQLADLDIRMADRKNLHVPIEEFVVDTTAESIDATWLEAKAWYGLQAAQGQVKPVVVLKTAQERHELPVNLLFKDAVSDVLEALGKPVHPLILETRERARTITERYS
ncbi:D-alanine--D-alanine ligase family protein [Larkinella terrae]|uniref:D-alanine--D-alanine ligase n=1 Tax=Larkinella terrae TaxID=2025311 RepID=A0A7K0EL80_9BACT|nr:D-alanine--D-alanine ligase [Larkinella terrae]MRS62462.1 D-alanine--D-alanine ligase [Larkinella terrae]